MEVAGNEQCLQQGLPKRDEDQEEGMGQIK